MTKSANDYINSGFDLSDNGKFDEAILEFTKAVEVDPKCADAFINRSPRGGIQAGRRDENLGQEAK